MGLLSDFFIASREEVDATDISYGPVDKFPCVQATTVEPVKICTLQTVVDGSTFDELLPTIGGMILQQHSEDGPWLIKIPEVVKDSLAASEPEELTAISTKWALTEEWQRDGGTPENLEPLVKELALLAKDGKQMDKQMYLWISL